MAQTLIRTVSFLVGLLGLRGLELAKPDHSPTVPLGQRWIANMGLGVLNGAIVSAACASCFVLSAWGVFPAPFAPLRALTVGPWIRIPLELLLLDVLVYALHRSYHLVPVLWRFHLVHHSDLDLDVSTASRFHTGEVLISSVVKVGVVGLLGISPVGLVVFEGAMLACAQFQHANLRIPRSLEAVLWATVVPPAMHRIHHTPTKEDTGSNFGTILTAWDAAFGTLRRRTPDQPPRFGVPELRDPRRLGILTLSTLPFQRLQGNP